MRHFFLTALSLAAALTLSACASTDEEESASDSSVTGEHAHPAANLVDRFPVHKKMESKKGKGPQVPFYFQRCEEVGEKNYYSRTSYECNYPF